VVFIDHQQAYLGSGVTLPAEDHRKNGEEPDRQDEAQRQSAAVAAQADQCGAHNGKNQSRNSLPVNCRNTDSRLGFRSEMSASSCPALDAESSNPQFRRMLDGEPRHPIFEDSSALFHPDRHAVVGVREPRQHLAARSESIPHQLILGPRAQ
jgi:hypothetical protein